MNSLIIKGFLGYDGDAMIAVGDKKDCSRFSRKAIAETIANCSPISYNTNNGLGSTKTIIPNCSIRIYITDAECSEDEAMCALLDKFEGECTTEISLEGYSEYTITGYSVDDFSIGGHNLEHELSNHEGKYMIFIIEYDD